MDKPSDNIEPVTEESLTSELIDEEAKKQYKKNRPFIRRPVITKKTRESRELKKAKNIDDIKQGIVKTQFEDKAKKIFNKRDSIQEQKQPEIKEANAKQEKELVKLELNRKLKEVKKEGKELSEDDKEKMKEKAKKEAKRSMDKIKINRARKSLNYDDSKRKKFVDKLDRKTNLPGIKSIKKVAQRKGDSLQRKRETWSKMEPDEKFDFFIGMIRKYLLKPILVFITMVIVIKFAKYLRGLYNKYPRAFTLTKNLDIGGKYDKSTGLDNELAETLGKSLADYISLPSTILQNINYKSKLVLEQNSFIKKDTSLKSNINQCDLSQNIKINDYHNSSIEPKYMNYIRNHLFTIFNINNNNKLYQQLRKFIKYKDEIFDANDISINDTKYKKGSNFKEEYDNKFFKEYLGKSKALSNSKVNKYLTDYYKNTLNNNPDYPFVNGILDTFPIKNFVKVLNNKDDFDINTQVDIETSLIESKFIEILKTKSTNSNHAENVREVFKNIFLRNVLYYIINTNKNIIITHLNRIEDKNILSYINPTIYTSANNNGIKLFTKYGKYLYLKENGTNSLIPFNQIINNRKASIPVNIYNKYKTPYNYENESEIETDIMQNIMAKLDLSSDYNGITFLKKYINHNEVFAILEKYKKSNNYKFDYARDYEIYKQKLAKLNIDTGNSILNNKTEYNNKKKSDKITGYSNQKDKCVLEIYNILYMIDYLSNSENELTSEEFTNYLYYIEKYTTFKYYDSTANKFVSLFDKRDKLNFINYFIEIQDDLLYIRDKNIINVALFCTLIFYSPDFNKETTENLLTISRFYMNFTELKLADNFIEDIKSYREKRTGYDFCKEYSKKRLEFLLKDTILIKYLIGGFQKIFQMKETFKGKGADMIKKITNPCIWFSTSLEKEMMSKVSINCKEEKFLSVERFLGGLLKIPRMLASIPDMASGIINLIKQIFQMIAFFFVIIGYIGKLGIIGSLILILKIIFYLSVTIFSIFLYLPFLFMWALPIVILCISSKSGNPVNIFNTGHIISTIGLLFLWAISYLFIDISIIEVLIIIFYSMSLLIITFFKTIIILCMVIILAIITFLVLIIDMISNYSFSRFLYKYFISCETSPFAWYKNSRYDLENKCSRGFFCNLNCGTNYRLSENGMFCEKAPTNVPYYCPQPLLYKTYKDEKINGKNHILSFFINNHPDILMLNPDKQKEYITNYKKNKAEYYQTCNRFANSEQSKGYNAIGKTICATPYNNKNKSIKNKIKDICQQTYCSNGNYENFCYKYNEIENNTNYLKFLENDNKVIEYFKKILFSAILISLIIYFIDLIKKVERGELIRNNLSLFKGFSLKKIYNSITQLSTKIPNKVYL
tara:strand:+ start:2483 stop:6541 length:4059 start_codon:yes stop_codon:yes gene_type:complete